MPDFGIMRGFNEKLFGDKLVAGQLPTQLGLIGSQEVSDFDADSIAFFARVTAAGGTTSATEQLAVDTLVKQMKANGIWSAMKAIYPMVGASAAACAQNLKSSSFTGSFSTGWTFSSTGITPNGTSAYMDTGCKQSDLQQNSQHLCIYSRTNISAGQVDMGIMTDIPNNGSYLAVKFSGSIFPTIQCSESSGGTSPYATTLGLIVGNRNNSTQSKFYQNGSLLQTFSRNSTIANITNNIYLGAYNLNLTGAAGFSTKQYAFSSIGDGLTDTQASNFYTAVQAFQTTLSRQV
jgi:hypothetical protein